MMTLDSIENKLLRLMRAVAPQSMTPDETIAAATPPPQPAPAPVPTAPALVVVTWPLQKDMPVFYGDPGGYESSPQRSAWEQANLTDVACPWVLNMDNIVVKQIRIHKKCADSLTQVLGAIWDATGKSQSAIDTLRYNRFSGSYAARTIRGGTSPSCHNFGAAIDWDDQDNQQHATAHLFQDSSLLVVKFKEAGWIWGGDWSPQSVDAMHVQAAMVHQ